MQTTILSSLTSIHPEERGKELIKGGTLDLMAEDARYETRDNDIFGLSRLEQVFI